MGIYTLKIKHQVIGYIFPDLYNTGMFTMLINHCWKSMRSIKVRQDTVIKTDITGHRCKIGIKYFTYFMSVIDYLVPFLKNYLISKGCWFVGHKRFDCPPKRLVFGASVTSFTKIGQFWLFIYGSCQISLFPVNIPLHLFFPIRIVQHIFLVDGLSKPAIHIGYRRLLNYFLFNRSVFINNIS